MWPPRSIVSHSLQHSSQNPVVEQIMTMMPAAGQVKAPPAADKAGYGADSKAERADV